MPRAATAPRARTSPFEALTARLRVPAPVHELAVAVEAPVVVDVPAAEAVPTEPTARREKVIEPPPAAGFGERAAPASPPPPQLQATRYGDVTPSGGTWALLIGINDYPGIRYDLHYAVRDIEDVDEALKRRGVTADRRMILRDRQATAGVIRAGLDWLTAHAGPDATVVLFYAGHIQKLGPESEALVGADGEVVTDAEVAAMLDRSSASRGWVGLAGCYAAGFTEVVRPGRIVTAAAPAHDLAYENDAFGRSYLVEYMVRRAMLGAGITTVEAAFAKASAELQRDHPDRAPVQFDQLEGELDLNPTPPPSPPPSGGGGGGAPPPTSAPPPREDGCANLTVGVVRCTR